jgi:hypothetical protein
VDGEKRSPARIATEDILKGARDKKKNKKEKNPAEKRQTE